MAEPGREAPEVRKQHAGVLHHPARRRELHTCCAHRRVLARRTVAKRTDNPATYPGERSTTNGAPRTPRKRPENRVDNAPESLLVNAPGDHPIFGRQRLTRLATGLAPKFPDSHPPPQS
jgi:hypothetical protein